MTTDNETIVRNAFAAMARGDVDSMLELVDPDLEWTFLDPSRADPEPQVCHGRDELGRRLRRGSQQGPELEELLVSGDRALVVTHSPDLDAGRARKTGDRNFHVVTVRGGRITALRACRNRAEAAAIAGVPAEAPTAPVEEATTTPVEGATTAPVEEATVPAIADLAYAIRAGDVDTVARLVAEHPDLVNNRLGGDNGRTPLHIATDWPGFFPNAPEIVRLLIAAGADPDLQPEHERGETPLHWAASSGDVEVAAALLSGGADIDAPDGSIGTPIENAVGYGCFGVARLLLASGARVDRIWVAAALGARERLQELLAERAHDQEEIDRAFWHACSGAQRRVAEYLHGLGADVNAHPDYTDDLPLDTVGADDTEHSAVVEWLKSVGARSRDDEPPAG